MTRFLSVCIILSAIGISGYSAARADSLPTFTATSASVSVGGGTISWSISGNGFSLGGFGGWAGLFASDLPAGSNVGNNLSGNGDPFGLGPNFGGSSGITGGSVTINGVSEGVQLQMNPGILFSTSGVTVPYGPNPVISLPATLIGPTIAQECLGPGLIPNGCNGPVYGVLDVANINIDVPGVLRFTGYSGDGDAYFTGMEFTSLPEPVSGSLACIGLMLLAGAVKLRKKA